MGKYLSLIVMAIIAATAPMAHADALLEGKRSLPVSTNSITKVNLTEEGTLDWVHWGLIEGDNIVNRKKTSQPLISELKRIGTREFHTYVPKTEFGWSDGQPVQEAHTRRALFIYAAPNGLEFSVPADTKLRELKVHCGLWLMQAHLEVKLGAGGPVFTDTVGGTRDFNGEHYVYTFRYRAASSGEKLTFRWSNVKGGGNVTIGAATLSEVKE